MPPLSFPATSVLSCFAPPSCQTSKGAHEGRATLSEAGNSQQKKAGGGGGGHVTSHLIPQKAFNDWAPLPSKPCLGRKASRGTQDTTKTSHNVQLVYFHWLLKGQVSPQRGGGGKIKSLDSPKNQEGNTEDV